MHTHTHTLSLYPFHKSSTGLWNYLRCEQHCSKRFLFFWVFPLHSISKSRQTSLISRATHYTNTDRRNYWQVSSSFTITESTSTGIPSLPGPEDKYHLEIKDNLVPITAFLTHICAYSSTEAHPSQRQNGGAVELVQHTSKRDKGPLTQPVPRVTDPGARITFERIQFRTATNNNGRRRVSGAHLDAPVGPYPALASSVSAVSQQFFVVVVEVLCKVASGEFYKVCEAEMEKGVVVRGRAPGHYSVRDGRESGVGDVKVRVKRNVRGVEAGESESPVTPVSKGLPTAGSNASTYPSALPKLPMQAVSVPQPTVQPVPQQQPTGPLQQQPLDQQQGMSQFTQQQQMYASQHQYSAMNQFNASNGMQQFDQQRNPQSQLQQQMYQSSSQQPGASHSSYSMQQRMPSGFYQSSVVPNTFPNSQQPPYLHHSSPSQPYNPYPNSNGFLPMHPQQAQSQQPAYNPYPTASFLHQHAPQSHQLMQQQQQQQQDLRYSQQILANYPSAAVPPVPPPPVKAKKTVRDEDEYAEESEEVEDEDDSDDDYRPGKR
ncbi:hypothetical protein BC830DRAFT_795302 [Chytriomyces sp. MP71]|nr:hypothetical protein BC830DRAFT_795302 [Chytriomyces sp. MP71]